MPKEPKILIHGALWYNNLKYSSSVLFSSPPSLYEPINITSIENNEWVKNLTMSSILRPWCPNDNKPLHQDFESSPKDDNKTDVTY